MSCQSKSSLKVCNFGPKGTYHVFFGGSEGVKMMGVCGGVEERRIQLAEGRVRVGSLGVRNLVLRRVKGTGSWFHWARHDGNLGYWWKKRKVRTLGYRESWRADDGFGDAVVLQSERQSNGCSRNCFLVLV